MSNEELLLYQEALTSIEKITDKHLWADELLGRRFNLFQIIRSGREEVAVHSAFLGSLLNPNGSHGMGNAFQMLFIDEIVNGIAGRNMDSKRPFTMTPEKEFENGRMDICLERQNSCIVIENKVYAADQEEQILRYVDYARKAEKNPENRLVIYLTLYGSEPSQKSVGKNQIPKSEYCTISYKTHIITWLSKCLLLAMNKPYVRENINQYMDLLKQLTGISETSLMTDVKQYILDKMTPKALEQWGVFQNALDELQNEKAREFFEMIVERCKKLSGTETQVKPEGMITCKHVRDVKSWNERGSLQVTILNQKGISIQGWYWSEDQDSYYSSAILIDPQVSISTTSRLQELVNTMDGTFEYDKQNKNRIVIRYPEVKIHMLRKFDWFDASVMQKWADTIASTYWRAITTIVDARESNELT